MKKPIMQDKDFIALLTAAVMISLVGLITIFAYALMQYLNWI